MDWSDWVQDVAGSVIKSAADSKYVQPYEVQKLRLQALGDLGPYTEGEPQRQAALGGISPTLLLLGGAALLFVMLRD